jgi:hypothetical protein
MEKEYSKYQEQPQIISELKVMKEAGIKTKCKDMEYINMHAEHHIRVNGKIINIMEKEYINLQMVQSMKETGSIIKCMELDFILIQMVENGKDNIEKESFKQKNKNNCYTKSKFK